MIDSIIFFIGTTAFYFAHWIISVLLVKFGSYEQAGVFSLAMSTGNVFFGIMAYGMRQYQVSDIKNKYSDNEYVLSRKTTCIAGFLALGIYLLFMRYSSEVAFVIVGYFIFKAIEAYVDVYNGISQKYGQMWVSGVSMLIRGLCVLAVFFIVYSVNSNLVTLVLFMCLSEFLCAFLFDYKMAKSKGSFSFKFNSREIKTTSLLLLSTFSLMAYSFSAGAFTAIPRIIIQKTVSTEMLGYFSSIASPTAVFNLLVSAVTLPLLPKIATAFLKNNKKILLKYLLCAQTVTILFGAIAVIFCTLLGRPVLQLLFNEKILRYFNTIYPIIISVVLIGLNAVLNAFLVSFRKLKQLLAFSASACVLVLILSLVLIPKYSIYGAAYAMIIASGIQFIAETVYILKIILSLKKNPAVVTGCTGSVGVALIEKLVDEGYTVYAVLNPDSNRNANIPDNEKVKKVFCSIEEYGKLSKLIGEKCSMFFHLAWAGTFGKGRNDIELQKKNIYSSLEAVRAAKSLDCKAFIGVGSQAEYGRVDCKLTDSTPTNPENEYGKAKLEAGKKTRELCNELGIRHNWVRLLSVFGPYDQEQSLVYSAVSSVIKGENPKYTKGEQIWDLLYCTDAADAIYLVGLNGKPDEIYVVGSGDEKPLKEYIKEIHAALNPSLEPVFGEREYSENQVMYLCADIEKLKSDTGFSAEIPFKEAIKRMAKEIK